MILRVDQAGVVKEGRRVSLALVLCMILFLPVAHAGNAITLTSPNAQFPGFFGSSVAVNEGDPIVVVGAPLENAGPAGGQSRAGHAYVLDTATGMFTTLTSPTPQDDGLFGSSVAVSGTTVVVGGPGESAGGKFQAGNAYVFDATGGPPIKTLTSPTPQSEGDFGHSVAVSGTTVVVGAPRESGGATPQTRAGNAYVFDSTTGFLAPKTLTSPNAQFRGEFGFSVAVSGATVVVGAPFESAGVTPQSSAGHTYVFQATDDSLIKTLSSPTPQPDGDFGWAVAVSCTKVVVGAPIESAGVTPQPQAGNAYVFDSATGFLSPTMLTSPYAQIGGNFGFSVAVGGMTVVVGAPREIVGLLTVAGHAYSFDASTGFLTTTLTSPNPQANGNFGTSVAVSQSNPTVVVGASPESGGGSPDAGHAYLFF